MIKKMTNKLKFSYQMLKSHLNTSQVSFLIAYVTNRCNFKCDFCFYYDEIQKGKKADELSVEEFERIAKKLGPVIQLSLTGGEPFLREDLDQISRVFIENCFVRYLTIPTNGSMTDITVKYLENVLPKFPNTFFRLAFSVDGIGEQHDRFRNTPGAFDKFSSTYRAVLPLKKKFSNLVLDVNSVFTHANEDSIMDTVKVLDKEYAFDNISVTYIRGDAKDASLKRTSFEKYIKLNDLLESLRRNKERRFLYPVWRSVRDISREYLIRTVLNDEFVTPCVAGRKMVILRETGEVQPCEILTKSFGNVRNHDYSIPAMLKSKENKEILTWIKETQCRCSFECALASNVIWGKPIYFKLLKSIFKNIGRK